MIPIQLAMFLPRPLKAHHVNQNQYFGVNTVKTIIQATTQTCSAAKVSKATTIMGFVTTLMRAISDKINLIVAI